MVSPFSEKYESKGEHSVDIPQAVDKQEVIGFNDTYFEPR